MCRERLHILSSSGDNMCRVRQNVPLRVNILSPATNCAGATKCAVHGLVLHIYLMTVQAYIVNFYTVCPLHDVLGALASNINSRQLIS